MIRRREEGGMRYSRAERELPVGGGEETRKSGEKRRGEDKGGERRRARARQHRLVHMELAAPVLRPLSKRVVEIGLEGGE